GTNGRDGRDGADGQGVAVTVELPGPHCPNGGFHLESAGLSSYVCHGADGRNGRDGRDGTDGRNGTDGVSVAVTPERPGAHCPAGGFRLDSGAGTSYVCNGSDAVTVTVEPPGAHCAAGGYALGVGGDVHYVCNGVDGTGGGTSTPFVDA